MAIYGGPDLEIQYTFIAVRPLTVEHPIGSGKIVTYQPGDVIPAGEWGNAAHLLVEMGKAERLAVNVPGGGGGSLGVAAASASATDEEPSPVTDESAAEEWPLATGGGWYTLSDGSRVRGQEAAAKSQAALDASEG